MKSFPIFFAAFALAGSGLPAMAGAQSQDIQAQQADNARQAADLRARVARTEARIAGAQQNRAITRARAADLRQQLTRTRASIAAVSRDQGFVSAAEFASYNRTLGAIDLELDRRGVARSYGNDMLVSPGQTYGDDMLVAPERGGSGETPVVIEHGYGNDALASAEVTAFQRMDARLRYRNARIERDRNGCAVYQGTSRDGRVRRVPLSTRAGKPICTRP